MIDNFDILYNYIKINDPKFNYLVVVTSRNKDFNTTGNKRTIKNIYFNNREELLNKKEEITKLCDAFNARAYLYLYPKSSTLVALESINIMSNRLIDRNLQALNRVYDKAYGKTKFMSNYILIDIDTKREEILQYINNAISESIDKEINIFIVETVEGYHYITSPFNTQSFIELLGDYDKLVEIHRNKPTLLYANIKE